MAAAAAAAALAVDETAPKARARLPAPAWLATSRYRKYGAHGTLGVKLIEGGDVRLTHAVRRYLSKTADGAKHWQSMMLAVWKQTLGAYKAERLEVLRKMATRSGAVTKHVTYTRADTGEVVTKTVVTHARPWPPAVFGLAANLTHAVCDDLEGAVDAVAATTKNRAARARHARVRVLTKGSATAVATKTPPVRDGFAAIHTTPS